MGYACPVCEAPQADGEHLANHLAFTAMLGREDHEAWLDEHAPGWAESNPDDLAEVVVDSVPETEFPQIFDDTTHDHDGTDHGAHDHQHGAAPEGTPFEQELAHQTRGPGRGDLSAQAQDVMAEAREMTEQMLDDEDAEAESDDANGNG
ncbi:DUF5810 domain-containing protein [Natronoarchaeum rubrum]|uniref:DUF5810 domain-containing protein n=1 Tax=Natronoarchaeum rubrum TaxID=755311 RepID=UPI002112571F|nr:DUF5810 domain-containing protein [Natronoarchaeum rubrum]